MRQVLVGFIVLILLGISEFFTYQFIRRFGVDPIPAVFITLCVCLGVFSLIGGLLFFRPQQSTFARSASRSSGTSYKTSSRSSLTKMPAVDDGFAEVATQGVPIPFTAPAHMNSDAFKDELQAALEQKRDEIAKLLNEAGKELSRFDFGVLKTLERNSPGSVEGVVIARKIFNALEMRYKEIDRFLISLPIKYPEKGQQLLLGDLEVPEDNKLTAVFQTRHIPPIKMSEVGFQLRVFLKRISRRRSIFRGNVLEIADEDGTLPQVMGEGSSLLPEYSAAAAAAAAAGESIEEDSSEWPSEETSSGFGDGFAQPAEEEHLAEAAPHTEAAEDAFSSAPDAPVETAILESSPAVADETDEALESGSVVETQLDS